MNWMRSNWTPRALPKDFYEQGLGETRHAFQEHVAPGQERHEEALDCGILAYDGLANFIAEFLGPSGTGGHVIAGEVA